MRGYKFLIEMDKSLPPLIGCLWMPPIGNRAACYEFRFWEHGLVGKPLDVPVDEFESQLAGRRKKEVATRICVGFHVFGD